MTDTISTDVMKDPADFFNEFYYVKFAVGPKHIKLLNDSLSSFPKEAKMLILTNSPELIDTSHAICEIEILDIDTIRNQRSLEYEKLIKATTEKEYISAWHALDEQEKQLFPGLVHGYSFPLSLFRYAIPWLLDRGYTKFILLDAGVISANPIAAFAKYASIKDYQNIIMIHPIGADPNLELGVFIPNMGWETIIKKYGVDYDVWPELGPWQWDPPAGNIDFLQIPMGCEGWMLGFWFEDADLIKKYFDMWEEITLDIYERKLIPMYNLYIFRLEAVINTLNAIFSRYFNVLIAANVNLVSHSYTGADGFMETVVWRKESQ